MVDVFDGNLRIERLRLEDVPAAAALICSCVGGREERRVKLLEDLLSRRDDRHGLFAAFIGDSLVGQARASYFEPPPASPPNVAPEGWYLLGVNVHPSCRRRGIGSKLVERRLEWLRRRADEVWYFTTVSNLASLELHKRYGFVEVSRDFWFPKVKHRGEPRILCRLELARRRSTRAPTLSA